MAVHAFNENFHLCPPAALRILADGHWSSPAEPTFTLFTVQHFDVGFGQL